MSGRASSRLAATIAATIAVSAAALAQEPPPKPAPAPVAGTWATVLDIAELGVANVSLVFVQDGAKLTGTYTGRYGAFPIEGAVEGRKLAFSVYLRTDVGDSTMNFAGEVAEDGKTMKGTATIEGLGDATWSAKREPDR